MARVLAAAAEAGYRPNAAARAMRLGRHSTVALLSSAAPGLGIMPIATLNALHDRLAEAGLRLLLCRLGDDRFNEPGRLPAIATEYVADAVVLNRILPPEDPVAEALEANRLPAIWFNIEREHSAVRPDDAGAGRMAVERLLALGHRRIAYANALFTAHISEADRRAGYLEAMRKAGLPSDARFAAHPGVTVAGPGMDMVGFYRAWLAQADRPTALVINEHLGMAPLLVACAMQGIRIPQDLSVLVIGGPAEAELMLRTAKMVVPEAELGTSLAEMVIAQLAQPTVRQRALRLPFLREEGSSLAPVLG